MSKLCTVKRRKLLIGGTTGTTAATWGLNCGAPDTSQPDAIATTCGDVTDVKVVAVRFYPRDRYLIALKSGCWGADC